METVMGVRRAVAAAIVSVGLAFATGAVAQPAQAPRVPLVQVDGLRSVSPHVQVIPDNSVPLVPNVGFIVGTNGVLVIDTGLGPKNGAAVADVAKRLAKGGKIWLVATHAHPEHELGAQAFPAGTTFIRSKEQAADVVAQGGRLAQAFAARSPAIAELLKGAEPRVADVTFDRDYTVDLGGVSAKLVAMGPNHTGGDTVVWVAAGRVLFSGDLAMRPQPSLMAPDTTIARWMASLGALEALKPAVVVPSHGPIGDVGLVQGYRAYLKEVAERTAQAKAAGASLEAATAEVTDAMAGRYPDKARLAGAVRVAYAGR
jgi:glyoxylase-like metal-dependent hydrolase (beta-lactamase superfamily II)